MPKNTLLFWALFAAAIVADQIVKEIILAGFRWESGCLSIILVYNDGVAFSMLSALGPWLKYLQTALIGGVIIYVFRAGLLNPYGPALGLLLGSGASNVIDRFVHGGVVDYIFWHCGFEFAVFNLADAVINFSVALLIYLHFKRR